MSHEHNNSNANQSLGVESGNKPTRKQQRRFERELRKLLKRNGDRCSICRTPFLHCCSTYIGTTADGTVANVSDCCMDKLRQIHGFGGYWAKQPPTTNEPPKSSGSEVVDLAAERAVRLIQSLPAREDEIQAKVLDQLRGIGLPEPDHIKILVNKISDDSVKADCERMARELDASVLICDANGKILAFSGP